MVCEPYNYQIILYDVPLEVNYVSNEEIYVPCYQYADLLGVYMSPNGSPIKQITSQLSKGFRELVPPHDGKFKFKCFGNNLCVCVWCDFDLIELILNDVMNALGPVTVENQRALKRVAYLLYPLNWVINQDVNEIHQLKINADREVQIRFNRYLQDRGQHKVIKYLD